MKTNFKFFFHLILATSFFFAFIYGIAETFVERYITLLSFGLLVIVVIGIAGMIRSVAALSAMEVVSQNEGKNAMAS